MKDDEATAALSDILEVRQWCCVNMIQDFFSVAFYGAYFYDSYGAV
jgi:hypothetical protein